MGTAILKIKIMPESPTADLSKIQEEAQKIIEDNKGSNLRFEKEPVAFGLVALIATFMMDESIPTDDFEENLKQLKDISSVSVIDFRRAFG
ncbi:elongation factor 1-beta [Candidatus Pacearchaeota archaeon]|nr:elongation factor 1-beta [Candidatus Pacearchaeota archaeon]